MLEVHAMDKYNEALVLAIKHEISYCLIHNEERKKIMKAKPRLKASIIIN